MRKHRTDLDILTKGQELSLHKDTKGVQFCKNMAKFRTKQSENFISKILVAKQLKCACQVNLEDDRD